MTRPRLRVVVLSFSAFASVMSSSVYSLAFSELARSFDVPYATLRWRQVVFWTICALGMPFFGKLCDRRDPRRMLLLGVVLDVVGLTLTALAPSFPVLLLATALHGLGDAIVLPAQSALIRHAVPPERAGWAFGLQTVVLAAAVLAGPILTTALLETAGWRVIIGVLAVVAAGSFVAAALLLPRVDAPHRAPTGILPRGLWKNGIFLAATAATLLGQLGMDSIVTFGPTCLMDVHHMTIEKVGAILLLSPGIVVLLAVFTGRLADRWHYATVAGGLLALIGAELLFASVTPPAALASLLIVATLIGVGASLFTPALNRLAFLAVPPAETASYMALYQMVMFSSGGIAGLAFGGLVEKGGSQQIDWGGYQTMLYIVAACAAASLVIMLAARRHHQRTRIS